jgi:hypothetical protein
MFAAGNPFAAEHLALSLLRYLTSHCYCLAAAHLVP